VVALSSAPVSLSSGQDGPGADADIIPGRYIVQLASAVEPGVQADALGRALGFQPDHVYEHGFYGFSADLPPAAVWAVARSGLVKGIEPDRVVTIGLHENDFQTVPTGVRRVGTDENPVTGIADGPGPDLDIDIAIIDTGIQPDHPDLRVVGGYTSVRDPETDDCGTGGPWDDDHGHGTHVAGTAAAKNNGTGVVGVAPGARLWALKVMNGEGKGCMSDVIEGVDWVTANAGTIDVVNMSLGGGNFQPLCLAIEASVAAGVIYVAAAGNAAKDAEGTSPANCDSAITVSAIADFDGEPGGLNDDTINFGKCMQTKDDHFACFSNFGEAVDIAAPGVRILSTYLNGMYATSSGTSMAAPHVAGGVAVFVLDTGYSGGAGAAAVMAAMESAGYTTPQGGPCGFTGDPDEYPEPLLHIGSSCQTEGGEPAPTPTPAPSETPAPAPTATPSPSPTPTPTPAPTPDPPAAEHTWGDVDCEGKITTGDSVKVARHLVGLTASQSDDCPEIGREVVVNGVPRAWGDVACDGEVAVGDAVKLGRWLIGLPVSQAEACPEIGADVTVAAVP
jgi:subtilisin